MSLWGRTTPLFSWRVPSSAEEKPPALRSTGQTKQREEASGGRALAVVLPSARGSLSTFTHQTAGVWNRDRRGAGDWLACFQCTEDVSILEKRTGVRRSPVLGSKVWTLSWNGPCSSRWDSPRLTEITPKLDKTLQQKHDKNKLLFSSDTCHFCKSWAASF